MCSRGSSFTGLPPEEVESDGADGVSDGAGEWEDGVGEVRAPGWLDAPGRGSAWRDRFVPKRFRGTRFDPGWRGVVTLTLYVAAAALPAIAKVVVTAVGLRLVMAPTVITPGGAEVATAVAAVRLLPVIITATVVPGLPEGGLTEVTVGTVVVPTPVVSIAPTSKFPVTSGRPLPKKSVNG